MAHTKTTLVTSGGTLGADSRFKTGNAVVPSTGIAINGTVAHGQTVRLTSGTDIDFGVLPVDFVWSLDLKDATTGADLVLVDGVTFKDGYILTAPLHWTTADRMAVTTATGFPYNKALKVGDLGAHNRDEAPKFGCIEFITFRYSSRVYKFQLSQWPAQNQINQLADHAGGEQIKIDWDYWSELGYQDSDNNINYYSGWMGTTDDGSVMEQFGALAKSNGTNFTANSLLPTPAENLTHVYIDATHQRPEILCIETLYINETPTNSAWVRVLSTVDGQIGNAKRSIAHPVTCNTRTDRGRFPGNCQGMNIAQNKNLLIAQCFKQYGSGAGFRVYISDVANPTTASANAMKKMSPCIIHSRDHHILEIEVIEGLFWDGNLSGNWFVVMDEQTFVGSVQIP